MNSLERIEVIFDQITENCNNLSSLLPQIYPIALECNDYIGFCLLYHWATPIGECKTANRFYLNNATSMLVSAGLTEEEANRIERIASEQYMLMRTIDEKSDQMCVSSAKEMEDTFSRSGEMISAIEIPNGLNPIDLYYKSDTVAEKKLKILENRQIFEKQYAILQSLMTTKLAEYQTILSKKERQKSLEKGIRNSKKIFIIHGHNEAKRRELESMLKDRFHLEPVALIDKPNQGMTIIEKFEKYAYDCSYAFAIFTPDDIITKPNGEQYFQARPNVIFELGWFYANLGRSRVCVLDQESEKSTIFSDLQGVMRIQFKNNISEKYVEIERELKSVGII